MKRTMLATIAAIASIGVVSLVHAAGDVQAGKVLSAAVPLVMVQMVKGWHNIPR